MGVFKRARIKKDGSKTPFWYIRYAYNGKIRWELVGKVGAVTKDVARARFDLRKKQVRLGQLDMVDAEIPLLSDFTEGYLHHVRDIARKRSWKRDALSLKHLVSFTGDRKLSAITPGDIQDYQGLRLKDGKKPSTVNRELACLKHLFNVAKQRNRFFGENPVSRGKILRRKQSSRKNIDIRRGTKAPFLQCPPSSSNTSNSNQSWHEKG